MILYDFLRSLILPLKEINAFIPREGLTVDLGCGRGVIAKYLAEKSRKRRIIGVDIDKKKLLSSNFKNLQFVYSDIRNFTLDKPAGVVISDVLHHLTFPDQRKLIFRVSKNLKKGGVLIIKEIDSNELIRSKLSRFWDLVLYPKDKIYYWHSGQLKTFLEKLGFNVTIFRPVRHFPGSITLYICRK